MNNKRNYEKAEITILFYANEDVLVASDDNYGYLDDSWGAYGKGGVL